MEDITFRDLEENQDVYNIIVKNMIIKNAKYNIESINYFKNYTKANKRALLDPNVKKYISKCIAIINIDEYFTMMDKFVDKHNYPSHIEIELHNYIIDIVKDNNNCIYGYDSMNYVIFETNYFDFDLNIKKILYKNIIESLLIDWENNHLYSYYDIIRKLIKVYDSRGSKQFRITFMLFIKKLDADLIKNNVDSLVRDKLIIKVIKSVNWTKNINYWN